VFEIRTDAAFYYNYGGGTTVFNNSGLVCKLASTGTSTLYNVQFNNAGTLDVDSGEISFTGSFTQQAAVLSFSLRGLTDFGHIGITGPAPLNGTLEVNLKAGFQPSAGDGFALVNYGSRSGGFTNWLLPILTNGLSWKASFLSDRLQLQALAPPASTARITGTVRSTSANAIPGVGVFAFNIDGTNIVSVSTVTDSNGAYELGVFNGTWQVGVQGLPALGFQGVASQTTAISGADQVVNFVASPLGGQNFIVTTQANPADGGTVTGAGSFPEGTAVTVTATADRDPLPYVFANWTESGVEQTTDSVYTFTLTRNRALAANFTLQSYPITATNDPPGGGTVTGTGSFPFGTSVTLRATPSFGYRFANWTEGGTTLGTSTQLTFTVYSNRTFAAHYDDAHLTHQVTTATQPPGLASVSGAGTYNNGQTATVSAPTSLSDAVNRYTFNRFTLNGSYYGAAATFNQTFATTDPTNMAFVAVYDVQTIRPQVALVQASHSSPVPATTSFVLTLRFDRSMRSVPEPLVALTNRGATLQPTVPTGGTWSTVSHPNDTYRTPAITFSAGMDGTHEVWVSLAQAALDGAELSLTNVLGVVVDTTPPGISDIAAVANPASAVITWATDELATSQVEYGTTPAYGSLSPLDPSRVAAHRVTVAGLSPDQQYYFRVRSRDQAGNETVSAGDTFTTMPAPDLQALNLTVLPPTGLTSGTPLTIHWTDTNSGPGAAVLSWYDRLVVSNRTAGTTLLDTLVYYDQAVLGTLLGGQSRDRQYAFLLPDGPDGAGDLVFTVTADALDNVYEYNAAGTAETNNTAAVSRTSTLAAYADLQVTALNVAPLNPLSGGQLTIAWQTTNSGNAPVTASFHERVTVRNLTSSETLTSSEVHYDASASGAGPIPVGGAPNRQLVVRLPDGPRGAGMLQVEVLTDSQDRLFEYNLSGTAQTNNAGSLETTSSLAAYPDLAIPDVGGPPSGLSGQSVQVSWALTNRGNATATGTWTDQVFLSGDAAIGNDALLGSFSFTGSLPAGQSLVRTQSVTLPAFGAGNHWLLVRTDVGNDLFELDDANNTGLATQPINLPANLALTFSRSSFYESAADPAATGTVTRNGDTSSSLTVGLASSNTNEVQVPDQVVIVAGRSDASFPISAVDDAYVDGPQTVTVTVSAAGFQGAADTVAVLDDDSPVLLLQTSRGTVAEGEGAGAAIGYLTRNAATNAPLTVTLTSDHPESLAVPTSASFAAGERNTFFAIDAVSNSLVQGTLGVRIVAAAPGYATVSKQIEVTDDDVPALTLTVADSVLAEGGPSPATFAAVTRSPVADRALTLRLSAGGFTDLILPPQVVIPANEGTVQFNVSVRDDLLVNSARQIPIRASVLSDFGVVLGDYAAQAMVQVLDNDGPTLTLHLSTDLVMEGASATATVSRNTDPSAALTVNLSSSAGTEAQVPATVMIPAGQASAPFTVSGVVDGVTDGTKPAILTAGAVGFNAGTARINVTDMDVPDLRLAGIGMPTSALSDTSVQITWAVTNTGLAAATGTWTDQVYLSTDNQVGADVLAGTATFDGSLAVNASYTRTLTLTLPSTPRNYWVIVVTDAGNTAVEGSEQNNAGVSPSALQVQPSYRATAQTETVRAPSGTPILIRGQTFNVPDGTPAPLKPVQVRITKGNIRRVLSGISDAQGQFVAFFEPLATEAGHYTLGAEHPEVIADPVQDQFDLVGFAPAPKQLNLRLVPNAPTSGRIELRNLGEIPLTGLTAAVSNAPASLTAQLSVPGTLPGSDAVQLDYTLTSSVTNRAQFQLVLHLTSAEGANAEVPLRVEVVPLRPELTANPPFLARGMMRGEKTIVAFDVTNVGGAPSGELTVMLPPADWLSLLSDPAIHSLAPGDKVTVTLALNPPVDLPLTRYDGSLGLVGDRAWLNMPFQFRAISDAVGDLRVTVTDEYTYFVAEAPNVTNATVRLRDPITLDLVTEGVTDAAGQALLTNVPEGSYVLEAVADKHSLYRGAFTIVPGIVSETKVFISRQTVTYRWTVVPIEIEDTYRIVLEPVFETEVPIPVVVMENPYKVPLVVEGEVTQFDIKLTNHGLIAANNVRLHIPYDPVYEVTPLVTNLGVMPARSSVTVPTTIQLREGTGPKQANAKYSLAHHGPALAGELRRKDDFPPMCTLDVHACLPSLPLGYTYDYECGGSQTQAGSGQLNPICIDQQQFDCAGGLYGAGKEALKGDLVGAGCDAALAVAGCLGADLGKCTSALLGGACKLIGGILTGGVGGGGGGGGGGLLECLCELLSWLFGGDSEPSGPLDDPGPGGGGMWIIPGTIDLSSFGGGDSDCDKKSLGSGSSKPGTVPPGPRKAGPGVCARVRIRIEQEAVMTRTAFLGSLEIDNDGSSGLTGIQVTLDIRDQNGNSVGDRFAIRGPRLSGLADVDGSGSLAAGASGSAQYTFIPTRDAAPTAPAVYRIGGTLRYVEQGEEVLVPLYSSGITVFPEARLQLKYFQQRDVYSDDPFTDEVEPAEPFALGLLAKNIGAGAARRFRITSAQPTIIENEKGLLIDFRIIGTQVGDQQFSPSLTANLGTILPGQSQVAEWWFTCTLQGKFVEYNATFEHVDSLGSTNLSLIDSVEVHELIHPVRADRPGDDLLPDFLVNDEPDPESLPDTLYLSDGTTAVVTLSSNPQTDRSPSPDNLLVHLTASMTTGWNYFKLPDPGPHYRLARVVRSDSKELRVGDNVWTTDRTFPSSQAGPVREFTLHLLDFDGTGSYTLYYRIDDPVAPTITAITGLTPGAQPAPVSTLEVVFSEPIDLATFDHQDLTLTRNGGANLITPTVTVSLVSGSTYRLNGLGALNALDGNYELTVVGGGIQDYGANPAANSATIRWALGLSAPVVVSVGEVSPDPRNTPVSTVDVVFSKPINPLTIDYRDLTLSRDGGANLVSGAVTVVSLSPTTFRVGGLASLTGLEGGYRLAVDASGIQDTEGNAGVGLLADDWLMATTGPRLIAIEHLATNPRNIVVASLEVTFANAIDPTSFSYLDLTLTRNGGPNLITSAVQVERVTDTVYRIREFNWVVGQEGTYTLTGEAAGIQDLAGNSGSGSISETWLMDTTPPAAPVNLAIAPDLGVSATDARTSASAVTFSGTLAETNLSVRLYDVNTRADLGEAVVVGTNFSHILTFVSPGAHQIRARAIDQAGNVSPDVFLPLFIDFASPVATFEPIDPNPRDNAVASAIVSFSEPISEPTLTTADFVLTRNDGPNLIAGTLSITRVLNDSYLVTGLAGLTGQPGEYRLSLKTNAVEDLAGNANRQLAEVRWLFRAPNTAPVLAAISDRMIGPGMRLTFTNIATDLDVPANRLTFSLGSGAPTGAIVHATSGSFLWIPARAQAPGIYPITVTVTDDGVPPLSDSESFTVTVTDYIELRVGEVAVRAGTDGAVPIHLVSSGSLTNLSLELQLSSDRVTNLVMQPLLSQIGAATVTRLAPMRYALNVRTVAGQSLRGDQYIALLNFSAAPSGPSEFVELSPVNVTFQVAESPLATTAFTNPGRVAVIEQQPLLEAELLDDQTFQLTLYGIPGTTYQIQYATDVGAAWTNWMPVTMSSLEQATNPITLPAGTVFFRAHELP
jgi:hypothetical protein